jgi:hypothetical protein
MLPEGGCVWRRWRCDGWWEEARRRVVVVESTIS